MPNIKVKGVEIFEEKLHGCPVTTIRIQSEQAAKDLEKEIGDYILSGLARSPVPYSILMDNEEKI